MNYGFPQINNSVATDLLTEDLLSNHEKRFTLHSDENNRNYFLLRHVNYDEIDPHLNEGVLDKRFVYSEITSRNQSRLNLNDTLEAIQKFRSEIIDLASEYGYPESKFESKFAYKFGHDLAVKVWNLMDKNNMSPVDAASSGIWNYLQVIGCPSVACWRWEDENKKLVLNRIVGGTRGAYAIAWWRYAVFTDFGEMEYEDWLRTLTEDAIQGIIERPGMRGYTPIIIPFAKRLSEVIETKKVNSSKFIRLASIQLRIKSSTINFWHMLNNGKSAEAIVDEIFLATEKLMLSK